MFLVIAWTISAILLILGIDALVGIRGKHIHFLSYVIEPKQIITVTLLLYIYDFKKNIIFSLQVNIN